LLWLAALAATVAVGFWLRQGILHEPYREMTWSVGKLGGNLRRPLVMTPGSTSFFGGRLFGFRKLALASATGESHGWLLACGWFYVAWHDTSVHIY
jgi:hypothetical protein